MSQKIKGVAKGLGIIAMFSCMFGVGGLALDITGEMQLAGQIQRFADTKIDLYALENGAGNDLITKDVFKL